MHMPIARLLFSTSNSPFSALIRAATWSHWSHVAIVDGETVIEATATAGVVRTPLWRALARSKHYALVDLPCADPLAAIAAAAGEIGKPYDYSAILGLALRRDWQEDDAWFCSELVAWAFDVSGQPLIRAEMARRITPHHLWLLPPATPGAEQSAHVSFSVPLTQ